MGTSVLLFISAIMCIAIVLGLYQAYLGCIVLIALSYFVYLLCRNKVSWTYIRKYFLWGTIVGIGGFIVYEIILKIELFRCGVEMSSYNGANAFSVKNIISNLSSSTCRAYEIFFDYFRGYGSTRWNLFAGNTLLLLVVFMCLLVSMMIVLRHRKMVPAIIALFSMFLMPIASNIVVILVPDSAYQAWQTAPLALVFPTLMCILAKHIDELNFNRVKKLSTWGLILTNVLVMWSSVYQTQIDQDALRQGSMAARTVGQSIISDLSNTNMYSTKRKYAIIGTPCDNPMVCLNQIYYKANGYAKITGGYWGSSLDSATWGGIFRNLLGINLPSCSGTEYDALLKDPRVIAMPIFPEDGSIQEIDGIVVIHIS